MKKGIKKRTKASAAAEKQPEKQYSILQKILLTIGLCVFAGAAFIFSEWALSFPFSWLLSAVHNDTLIQALYSLASYALTIVILFFLPKIFHKSWKVTLKDLGLLELPTFTDIGLAIVGLVVYFIYAAILSAIFAAIFPWFDANQTQNTGFNNMLFGPEAYIALTILVLVAPIAEEIIFRGFLYGKLRSVLSTKAKVVAILLTSLVFGFMHGQWNVAINVFAMSMVLCFMREITGTIYAGVILHIIKNAIAFYLIYAIGLGAY